jgi:hypothetical protein
MRYTDEPRWEGIASKAFYLLLAAATWYLLIFITTTDIERILSVIPDDAAYFFKIAENVARGAGETFDGLNRTNGYQPLWMYLLVPVYYVREAAPETLCRVVLAAQTIMLAAATALLYAWCTRFFLRRIVLVGGVVFLVFVFMSAVNGMESALLVTLLSVLIVIGWKMDITAPGPVERDLFFGMVAGLVVLARLDMVFLPVVLCSLCLGRGMKRGKGRAVWVRKGVAIGAGTVLIVAPYLIRNHLVFGSPMPISGALKTTFPRASLSMYAFSRMGLRDLTALLLSAGYLVWAIYVWLRDSARSEGTNGYTSAGPGYFRITVGVLSAAVVLHFLHTALFMRWAVFRWHFLFYSFVAYLVICEAAARLFSRERLGRYRAMYAVCVVLLIAFCCIIVVRRYGGKSIKSWVVASYRAAKWAEEHTGTTEIFAMKDAGNFCYFSRRSVISLDGVVNNMTYQDVIREGRLGDYLAERNVVYLVQHAFWNREDVNDGTYEVFPATYWSRLYGVESDTLLFRKEWEVYRSEPYFDGPHRTVFIIWKIQGMHDGG